MQYWRQVIRLAIREIVNEKRQAALGALLPTALTLVIYWAVARDEFGSNVQEIAIAVAVGVFLSLLLFLWRIVTIPPRLANSSRQELARLHAEIQDRDSREISRKAWLELESDFSRLRDTSFLLIADLNLNTDVNGNITSESWTVRGGSTHDVRERWLVLAGRAGDLIHRSAVLRHRFPFVENANDPDRWLYVVKDLGKSFRSGIFGQGTQDGIVVGHFYQSSIEDLARDSALACFKLANDTSN